MFTGGTSIKIGGGEIEGKKKIVWDKRVENHAYKRPKICYFYHFYPEIVKWLSVNTFEIIF